MNIFIFPIYFTKDSRLYAGFCLKNLFSLKMYPGDLSIGVHDNLHFCCSIVFGFFAFGFCLFICGWVFFFFCLKGFVLYAFYCTYVFFTYVSIGYL